MSSLGYATSVAVFAQRPVCLEVLYAGSLFQPISLGLAERPMYLQHALLMGGPPEPPVNNYFLAQSRACSMCLGLC